MSTELMSTVLSNVTSFVNLYLFLHIVIQYPVGIGFRGPLRYQNPEDAQVLLPSVLVTVTTS